MTKKTTQETVVGRLLSRYEPRQGVVFDTNTLLELTPEQANILKSAGLIDDSAEAVKYCTDELGAKAVPLDAANEVNDNGGVSTN